VEGNGFRLHAALHRLDARRPSAPRIFGIVQGHPEVEHHLIGPRHAARRPGFQESADRRIRARGPLGKSYRQIRRRFFHISFGDHERSDAQIAGGCA
jgi:hypothetical protein